jgi:hypothetical protein
MSLGEVLLFPSVSSHNKSVLFSNLCAFFWSGKLEEVVDQGVPAESELNN